MNLSSVANNLAREISLNVEETAIGLFYRDRAHEKASVEVIAQRLANYIYADFHAGLSSAAQSAGISVNDRTMRNALEEVTPKKYREVQAKYLREIDKNDVSEIVISGVRVAVTLPSSSSQRIPDEIVTVKMQTWRPRLSPGFFLTESAERPFVTLGPMVRLYVHIENSADAPTIWGSLSSYLCELRVPFRAKILAVAEMYPRHDALVLYLTRPSWPHLEDLVDRLSGLPGVVSGTSVFVREIRPGIGLAFQHIDSRDRYRQMSFGQHRATIVADSLIDRALGRGLENDVVKIRAQSALIDVDNPWRNTSSPDVLLYL
ncbi:T3SS effector HopA1 family protein [Rathayibacter toxicus]|uniref:T3SS effector HopA1 family protein n=1 Tax=Rathayibacter toxicus TaxID=145458 RepID=UPI000CE7F2C4|nr:T3SS effector HopA1 family protein [Rathayibacter toxicus]PPI56824.1 hypothetical protein C5D35_00840 [Rathayibacter toxicus]QOD10409.1 hypothetical protein BSG36_11020 [Rathayibacter toxicus]QWL29079.1 hypothetical protein E2R33_11015 [Rathayibacter toxicus]